MSKAERIHYVTRDKWLEWVRAGAPRFIRVHCGKIVGRDFFTTDIENAKCGLCLKILKPKTPNQRQPSSR